MTLRSNIATFLLAASAVALAGCTSAPVPIIKHEGPVPIIHKGATTQATTTTTDATGTSTTTLPEGQAPATDGEPSAQLRRGNGVVINQSAAGAPPPQPVEMQDADELAAPLGSPPPAPQTAANKPQTVGSTLPETPMTPEAQMEAIRKRIEQRRAQLREEAQRQQQSQPTQNPAK